MGRATSWGQIHLLASPLFAVGTWFSGRSWVGAGLGPVPGVAVLKTDSRRAGIWLVVKLISSLMDQRGKHMIL